MIPTITLSDSACQYIKKMLEKSNHHVFRLSIKKTGCSGYSYAPSTLDCANEKDISLTTGGITVSIDPQWKELLQHLHIDYAEDDTSGIKQKKLVFTNPNEASRCGCGESFHVESP